jgi:heptosyltransferase II
VEILVIRPDAIGDLVLTLPAIQAVKEHYPGAKITALIREDTKPVADCSPAIDRVIFDYDLKKYKFDLSINYYNQGRDTFAAFRAGIPQRLGDSSRVLTAWMNNLKVFRNWNDFSRHEVEFNCDLLRPLGIKIKELARPNLKVNAKAPLELDPHQLTVGLHVGARTSKSWSARGFAELAAWLVKEKRAQVLLLGGPAESAKAEEIAGLSGVPVTNLAGKISLAELIAVIAKLKFFLGMDTGPTHLAAAFGIPLVMLCLNHKAKPLRWGPWLTRHLVCLPTDSAEVIAAADTVLKGGGVATRQDSLYHWAQQSLGIAIVHDAATKERAAQLASLLQAGGYRHYLTEEKNVRKLLDFFVSHDTLVIHRIGRAGGFAPFLAQQFTGSYLASRALLINDQGENFGSPRELIDLYLTRARQA